MTVGRGKAFDVEVVTPRWIEVLRQGEPSARRGRRVHEPEEPLTLRVARAASVAGTILDDEGRPMAFVRYQLGEGRWRRTDGLGRFEIERLFVPEPETVVPVKVLLGDFVEASPSIRLNPGKDVRGATVTLPVLGSLRGVLRDDSGSPVAGALVEIGMRSEAGTSFSRETLTTSEGRYRFPRLLDGQYAILVRWNGHRRELPDTALAVGEHRIEDLTIDR